MVRTIHNESGFSLIELFTVIAMLAALALTAISNFSDSKTRGLDTMSLVDYRNIKTVVLDEAMQQTAGASYLIQNVTGPGSLPAPLEVGRLSKDVRLYRARRRTWPDNRERIVIVVGHLNGDYRYRYVSVNGNVVEQVIQN